MAQTTHRAARAMISALTLADIRITPSDFDQAPYAKSLESSRIYRFQVGSTVSL